MVDLKIHRKANGVPFLSKRDIEVLAKTILEDYNPSLLREPAALDVEHLLECYAGLEVDYKDLTHNQTILGMIVFDDGYVQVYNKENNKVEKIVVEEGTVLIDNSLLRRDQIKRGRFTVCHEIAHWFLHRYQYRKNRDQLNLFDVISKNEASMIKCRATDIESKGNKKISTEDDWMEWQADNLASALLMPEEAAIKIFQSYVKRVGLKDSNERLMVMANTNSLANEVPRYFAEIFDVSLAAAKIRLKNLNLMESIRQQSIF